MFLFVCDIPDFRELLWLPFLKHCQGSWRPTDIHRDIVDLDASVLIWTQIRVQDPSPLRWVSLSVKCTNGGFSNSTAPEQIWNGASITNTATRSAPEADVAHGLAGGAGLCRREVDLATGADTHLVYSLLLGGLIGWQCVDAQWETTQLNGVGI